MTQILWLKIIFLSIFVFFIGRWLHKLMTKKKKKYDKREVTGFIHCLIVAFHHTNWHQIPDKTKSELAKKIIARMETTLGSDFRVLMLRTKTFPRKCSYPSADLSTTKLVNQIFILMSDLHTRYRQHPTQLESLKKEFFHKLEEFIFHSLVFDRF